jgi:hypothetical protein
MILSESSKMHSATIKIKKKGNFCLAVKVTLNMNSYQSDKNHAFCHPRDAATSSIQ